MDEVTLDLIVLGVTPIVVGVVCGLIIRAVHASAMAKKAVEEADRIYFDTEEAAKAFISNQVFKYGFLQQYGIERLPDGRYEVVPGTRRAHAAPPPPAAPAVVSATEGGFSFRFRIRGADRETGEECTFDVVAENVQEARKMANAAGYLVNRVEPI